jgi:hypothetical protein
MPTPPPQRQVSYWTHCFDLGRWRLIETYANGQGLFEPIEENLDRADHCMTAESRRRRYYLTGMDPHF